MSKIFRYKVYDAKEHTTHLFMDIDSVSKAFNQTYARIQDRLLQSNNITCQVMPDIYLFYKEDGWDGSHGEQRSSSKETYSCYEIETNTLTEVVGIEEVANLLKVCFSVADYLLHTKAMYPLNGYIVGMESEVMRFVLEHGIDTIKEEYSLFEDVDSLQPMIMLTSYFVGNICSEKEAESNIKHLEMKSCEEDLYIPYRPGIVTHPVFKLLSKETMYFNHMTDQINYILTNLEGRQRWNKLGLNKGHYEEKESYSLWRKFFNQFTLSSGGTEVLIALDISMEECWD